MSFINDVLRFANENPQLMKTVLKHASGYSTVKMVCKVADKAYEIHQTGKLKEAASAAAVVGVVGLAAKELITEDLDDVLF